MTDSYLARNMDDSDSDENPSNSGNENAEQGRTQKTSLGALRATHQEYLARKEQGKKCGPGRIMGAFEGKGYKRTRIQDILRKFALGATPARVCRVRKRERPQAREAGWGVADKSGWRHPKRPPGCDELRARAREEAQSQRGRDAQSPQVLRAPTSTPKRRPRRRAQHR